MTVIGAKSNEGDVVVGVLLKCFIVSLLSKCFYIDFSPWIHIRVAMTLGGEAELGSQPSSS